MRPFIGDRYGTFTLLLAGGRVSADADLDELPVVMDQGDIGHALPVISVHQLLEHAVAGLVDLRQKAHVPRLGGQALDKRVFTLAIFFRQRPDQHMAAVFECFNPVLSGDCGVSGSGPIIVVFDVEHGGILHPGLKVRRVATNPAVDSFLHCCRCLNLIWIRQRCRRH
ncbi:hypothetical protein D3C87_1377530 [compost metagenome]